MEGFKCDVSFWFAYHLGSEESWDLGSSTFDWHNILTYQLPNSVHFHRHCISIPWFQFINHQHTLHKYCKHNSWSSRMAISVESLLKERKYPFIFTFMVLLICFTILTFTSTSTSTLDPIGFYPDVKPQPLAHFSSPSPKRQRLPLKGEPFLVDATIDWKPCKGPLAMDYIPCLDNFKAIKALKKRRHMEHRERHCPHSSPHCLVPLPKGYKVPLPWPKSRDMVRLIVW